MTAVWVLLAAAVVVVLGRSMRERISGRGAKPGEGLDRVDVLPQAPDDWVAIHAGPQSDVFVAYGLLESNGVRSAVQRVGVMPSSYLATTMLRLCVAPEDVEQARALLGEQVVADPDDVGAEGT